MQNAVTIQIIAEPAELPMDKRAGFKIGMEMKNVGDVAIDPKIYDTVLLVNGKRDFAWDLAVQNSPREEAWWHLEPGHAVRASWPLGEAMFPQPGDYAVVLRLGGLESSVLVRVIP